jgi:hypothetical protein
MNHSRFVRSRQKKLVVSVFAVAIVLFSPLGWCPPPPGDIFTPDAQTFDFGSVAIGSSKSITLTYLVAPAFAAMGPFQIATGAFSVWFSLASPSISIDPGGTTCVPGAVVTTVSGCAVTLVFAPTSIGPKNARVNVSAAPVSNPAAVSGVSFNNLVGNGVVAAVDIPTQSTAALGALSGLIILLVAGLLRRTA